MSVPARASPVLELVGSNFGTGGFNARADGPSAASAYFNPALLPWAPQGFALGTLGLNDAISITLHGRSSSVDVPVAALNNFNDGDRAVGTFPAVPTSWLENGCQRMEGACTTDLAPQPRQQGGSSGTTRVYQALGFVGQLFQRRLSLAVYTLVPLRSLVEAHSFFPDEREQFFTNSLHPELYADRLSAMSMVVGAGSRVTEWLGIGASVTVNLASSAAANAYIGDSADLAGSLRQSARLESTAALAPHFAATILPFETLRASVTLHSPQRMDITTATSTYLPNGDRQESPRKAVHGWLPWIAGLGLSYSILRTDVHDLAVTGTGTYQQWSQYVNRHGERPLRNYEWNDTFNAALGVRYTYDGKLATFLDGNYRPTPVPLQTGRTNYVDNEAVGLAGGASYDFPIDDWGVRIQLGVHALTHFLRQRQQTKIDPTIPQLADRRYSQLVVDEWSDRAVDSRPQTIGAAQGLQTNNPGWPGFGSSGFLWGAGATAAVLY
jgi:hypothetical protein